MNLYRNEKGTLSELKAKEFALEKDIQRLVEENLQEVFGYELVRSEFPIKNSRIDSFCFDRENNSFVIIEYKKGRNDSIIDQGFNYLSLITKNKADCVMEYNEQTGSNLKRSDIDWDSLKVIFVSPHFNKHQKGSVDFKDWNFFELWEIKQFENGYVSLSQVKTESNESINKRVVSSNRMIKEVTSEVKSYSEDNWLEKADQDVKRIWYTLKDRLDQYEMSDFHTRKHYTQFKKNNAGVCFIKLRKTNLHIVISRGNKQVDGKKSKNFFSIDDPKNFCKESHFTFNNGIKRYEYIFKLSNLDQIDYADFLIKQKYKSV